MIRLYKNFFGDFAEHKEAAYVTAMSVVVFMLYGYFQQLIFNQPTTTLEFLASFTSLACVWLTRKENLWSWPLGIISVVFLGAYFFKIGLISQAGLQILYYFPIQFWGWYVWVYKGGAGVNSLKVTYLTNKERGALVIAAIAGFFAIKFVVLSTFAEPVAVAWDTSITVASIIAQVCLSYKKVEAWWLWLIPVNISAIGLYIYADAYMIAALYTIYLVNAGIAIYDWTREAKGITA